MRVPAAFFVTDDKEFLFCPELAIVSETDEPARQEKFKPLPNGMR
jgi:hypothetical protein